MKPTPPGWPRISNSLWYADPKRAIDWLCEAFGFEVRLKVEGDDGELAHSELTYGDGLIMIGGEGSIRKGVPQPWRAAPSSIEGKNTQNIMVFVDDVDAHCAHARKAGATIVTEPQVNDYGPEYWTDKTYECVDLGGHHWWFCQRLRSKT